MSTNQRLSGTVAHQTAAGLFHFSARALMDFRVASAVLEPAPWLVGFTDITLKDEIF